MSRLVELLAPVGSREALIAAVESGADAVYLAGKMFGARAYAANFENDELSEAITFAHRRHVRVLVAVNTLVDDSEFEDLANYLKFLYTVGTDAIIVQDLGVVRLAKEIVPNLPLHASTQLTVHNLEGVRFMESLGFTRVVLAREVSLEEINYICRHAQAEIEVFIHGALCICYSGQCLMSGMIGGRSGNRGRCAQPCRLPYTLVDDDDRDLLVKADAGEYLLSPKDMNAIELIPELMSAGVASFKIEGRMKRPEYVAVVVDTYRRRIDAAIVGAVDEVSMQDKKDLAQIFNRDFTTAYLKARLGRLMMSDRRPNNRGVLAGRVVSYDMRKKLVTVKLAEALHVGDIVEFWVKVGGRVNTTIGALTVGGRSVSEASAQEEVVFSLPSPVRDSDRVFKVFDAKLMERARSFFQAGAPIRRFAVDINVVVKVGEPLRITITDEEGFCGEAVTDFIAEPALKRPLTEETVRKQIERLGTSVFVIRTFTCEIQGEVMVPVSEINEARRKAVEKLEDAGMARYKRSPLVPSADFSRQKIHMNKQNKSVQSQVCVNVDTIGKVFAALDSGADVILFGGETYNHQPLTVNDYKVAAEAVKARGKQIIFNTPRIMKQGQVKLFQSLCDEFHKINFDGISIQNVAFFELLRSWDIPLFADISLNLYNTMSLEAIKSFGAVGATLSPELNMTQIERIAASVTMNLECIVHGNLELMVSEYCTMGSYLGGLDKGCCSTPCKQGRYYLSDRKGERFPLVTDQYCRMHVLNGKILCMLPHVTKLAAAGIQRLRIEGKLMTEGEVAHWTKVYSEMLALGDRHPLLINGGLEAVEPKQMTRGHYFRGVL